MVCWNPCSSANIENSWDVYCGLLSLCKISGIPCRANIDLREVITAADVLDASLAISGYLEKYRRLGLLSACAYKSEW